MKPVNKTATINIYHTWGTKNGYCAVVLYRGKVLVVFDGEDKQEIQSKAETWAKNQNFSKTKLILG